MPRLHQPTPQVLTKTIVKHATVYKTPIIYADQLITNNNELDCMAKTIYFEAGNQPVAGKIMVGLVVIQRLKNPQYPKTICGVVHQHQTWDGKRVGCQFSWYCYRHVIDMANVIQRKTWDESLRIAKLVLSRNFFDTVDTDRMTMYHANYIHPYWASSPQYKKFLVIGDQSFYLTSTD
jgi:spore germination cell wall hydrolase CwlJ-like protein